MSTLECMHMRMGIGEESVDDPCCMSINRLVEDGAASSGLGINNGSLVSHCGATPSTEARFTRPPTASETLGVARPSSAFDTRIKTIRVALPD